MGKKNVKRLLAMLALLSVVVSSIGGSVFAAGKVNTPVNGTTTQFDKYLVLDQQANVPNAQFAFTVSAGTHIDGVTGTADSNANPEILAGVEPEKVTVTIGKFAPGDTTATTAGDSTVVLEAGEKFATKVATVSFENVQFRNPGVYRYVIKETDPSIDGIVIDDVKADGTTSGTRILDVYIDTDEDGRLFVNGYTLHKSVAVAHNSDSTGGSDATTYESSKDKGFQNKFITSDLTIEKQTTGNMGNRAEYFKFTVEITGAIGGSVFDVDLTNAEASPDGHTNVARLTASETGAVTQDFWLKDDQSIKIQGLNPSVKYKVTETTVETEGYRVSHVITSGEAAGSSQNSKVTALTTIGEDDDTVVYTNYRNGVVPTGYFLEYAPYIIASLLFAVALIVFAVKSSKRKRA